MAWVALTVAAVTMILLSGLGVATLVRSTASGEEWGVLANVGEAFGALNAIISGLALVAVVATFVVQFSELRSQSQELALQRESLIRAHTELHRSAEADIRRLHVELVKAAIDDPTLTTVWPLAQSDLSPERRRQYMYVNLILQHLRLQVRMTTDAELKNEVRYVFASAIVRDYWKNTAPGRAGLLVPGTAEYRFAQLASEVCAEYEAERYLEKGSGDERGADGLPDAA